MMRVRDRTVLALLASVACGVVGIHDARSVSAEAEEDALPTAFHLPTWFVPEPNGTVSGQGSGETGELITKTKQVRVPGTWRISYFDSRGLSVGFAVVTVSGGNPPKPDLDRFPGASSASVTPVFETQTVVVRDTRRMLGVVSVEGAVEAMGRGRFAITELTVSASGDQGFHSADIAAGQSPVLALRSQRSGGQVSARARALLEDGSQLRISAVVASPGYLTFEGTLSGPLAQNAFGVRTVPVRDGALYYTTAPGNVDFDVVWHDSRRGTATLHAPFELAGATAPVVRTGQGLFRIRVGGSRRAQILVRGNGLGSIDLGYGRLEFPEYMVMGDGADALTLRDAWDPVDDVSSGATQLQPTSAALIEGHSLSFRDTTDWYQIDLERGMHPAFGVTGPLSVVLVSPSGSQAVSEIVHETGSYYLRVSGPVQAPAAAVARSYTLQWTALGAAISEAVVLEPTSGGTIATRSFLRGNHDWYSIDVAAGEPYSFAPAPTDLRFRVYDDTLNEVTDATVRRGGNGTTTFTLLTAGRYYVDCYGETPPQTYSFRWTQWGAFILPYVSNLSYMYPPTTIAQYGTGLSFSDWDALSTIDGEFFSSSLQQLFVLPNQGPATIQWTGYASGNGQVFLEHWNGVQFQGRDIRNATAVATYSLDIDRPLTESHLFVKVNCSGGQVFTDHLAQD